MHAWEPRGGKTEEREVDAYLYASFLSSSLCLCLPNRSAYGYQADTRAALGSTDLFPKMAPLCFFSLSFLFSFSNQSNPELQRYTATRRSRLRPCVCELGYQDDSLFSRLTCEVRRENKQSLAFALRLLQTAV